MCKQQICKTIFWVNQNEQNVNFSPPYVNHKILVIPKSFIKSLHVTAYFYGLITSPTFLVQSVEVTFSVKKRFTWFTLVYTGLHPFAPRCAPLSCTKRGDLVREPHNAARNRCDATCWLDCFGDQAHSAQRQAVHIMLMTVSPLIAVLIISKNDWSPKTY